MINGQEILPDIILEKIKDNIYLQKVINGTYLNDPDNPNFVEVVQKHFKGDRSKAQIINSGSGIGGIFYDWIKAYSGSPKSLYAIDWNEVYNSYLITGNITLKINLETRALESIGADEYVKLGETEYFLKPFSKFEDGKEYKYILIETFENKIFTRKLYETSDFNLSKVVQVPLDTIKELKGQAEKIIIDLPTLVYHKKIGYSKLRQVLPKINAIDRKILLNEYTIGNYNDSWIILRGLDLNQPKYFDNLDADGSIGEDSVFNFSKVGRVLATYNVDENGNAVDFKGAGVEVVGNNYDNIEIILKMIEEDFKIISSITHIPMYAFLSNSNQGIESGKARNKLSEMFYKDIQVIHNSIKDIFNNFWTDLQISEKYQILELPEIVSTTTDEILKIDENKLKNIEKKVSLGLISRIDMFIEMYGMSEEKAKLKILEIDKEKNVDKTEITE